MLAVLLGRLCQKRAACGGGSPYLLIRPDPVTVRARFCSISGNHFSTRIILSLAPEQSCSATPPPLSLSIPPTLAPDLARSAAAVKPTDRMLGLSLGQLRRQYGPSPEAPAELPLRLWEPLPAYLTQPHLFHHRVHANLLWLLVDGCWRPVWSTSKQRAPLFPHRVQPAMRPRRLPRHHHHCCLAWRLPRPARWPPREGHPWRRTPPARCLARPARRKRRRRTGWRKAGRTHQTGQDGWYARSVGPGEGADVEDCRSPTAHAPRPAPPPPINSSHDPDPSTLLLGQVPAVPCPVPSTGRPPAAVGAPSPLPDTPSEEDHEEEVGVDTSKGPARGPMGVVDPAQPAWTTQSLSPFMWGRGGQPRPSAHGIMGGGLRCCPGTGGGGVCPPGHFQGQGCLFYAGEPPLPGVLGEGG